MSDYTKITDFAAKDTLPTGNPAKVGSGTEVDAEFDAIAVAIATKFDSADRGAANGIASLDAGSLVPAAQLPDASLTAQGIAELATTAETITGTDATRTVTPAGIQAVLDQNAGVLNDISDLVDPAADRIGFWDDSANNFTWLSVGTNLSISGTVLSAPTATIQAALNHDALPGFVSNEHIDHSAVILTAGVGITGGGTIAASRTFNLDISGLGAIQGNALVAADGFLVDDAGTMSRMAYSDAGLPVSTVTGTTDTLVTADMNTFIEYTNAGAVTVTLNAGVGVVGNVVVIKQTGAGQVTVSGTATLESSIGNRTRTVNSVLVLVCIAAGVWALYGDMAV